LILTILDVCLPGSWISNSVARRHGYTEHWPTHKIPDRALAQEFPQKMMNLSEQSTEINAWHMVGLVSSFPDISQDKNGPKVLPGCKTLSIPKSEDADQAKMNRLSDLNDQVLVFKYKGFMHAIDNVC
jgi:hypothetical protein